MNDTKHNPANAGQDSDDLIAELARLVAQDARAAAAPASAYRREEPQVPAQPEPEAGQEDFYEAEPSFGAPQEFSARDESHAERDERVPDSGQNDTMPAFDFGFGAAQDVSADDQQASGDPIADLIADAEVATYESDSLRDEGWSGHDDGLSAEPEPSHGNYGRANEDVSGAAPVAQERDPLGEIEALIGEAARANAADAGLPAGRRVKSSFLDDYETDAAVDAAESAILAAAAATGTPVRRVQPANDPEDWLVAPTPRQIAERPEPRLEAQPSQEQFIPDPLFAAPSTPHPETPAGSDSNEYVDEYTDEDYAEETYAEEQVSPRRSRRALGGLIIPVAAGALIFALIGGVYFAFFSGPGDPGEAPVLTADASPLKEDAPASQNDSTASESVVFSEIEGNTTAPEDEALVSRDQTNGASGAQVAEVLAPEEGETALANRPVRTVTVRPDGTIVPATDSVAGSNVLPVERPDVPAVPNSTLTSDPIGEAIALAMAGSETAAEAGAEGAASEAGAAVVDAGVTEAADEGVTAPAETEIADAPRPIPRPAGLTAQTDTTAAPAAAAAAPVTETVAAATPAQTTPAPAAATPTPTSNVGAWVQLSSQRSEADAQADIPSLQARYGTLFNGATPEVSQVDLGERGIYYRVRLPQPTFDQANSVCSAIQAQGGDCFVLNN
eukprot:jgi/Tetstr1/450766/TSEL_037802.t1